MANFLSRSGGPIGAVRRVGADAHGQLDLVPAQVQRLKA